MHDALQLSLRMNPYLFGSILLMVFWFITFWRVRRRKEEKDLREFWWASWTGCFLGVSEPLYVPEYWDPPSVLKFYRWDLESFVFCFAVGGIAAVLTELPRVRKLANHADDALWEFFGRNVKRVKGVLGAGTRGTPSHRIHPGRIFFESEQPLKERGEIDNAILVTFFLAMFGTTAQLNLNIIYDAAIVCLSTAGLVWWRKPRLRWQIIGGAFSFTLLYAIVLTTTHAFYPDFFTYWKLDQLSGIFIAQAPLEEYLFAFTFGALWAPIYEAWNPEARRARVHALSGEIQPARRSEN